MEQLNICAKIASQKRRFFEPLRYFGIDQWDYFRNKRYNRRTWIISIYSALLGGISHLLLDWPSHNNVYLLYPWFFGPNSGFLRYSIVNYGTISLGVFTFEANLTISGFLWIIESIITLILSLWFLRYIKKKDLIRIWYE